VWDENEDEREIIIDRLMGMDCQFIRPNPPKILNINDSQSRVVNLIIIIKYFDAILTQHELSSVTLFPSAVDPFHTCKMIRE